jgi:hypothetical protein
MHCDKILASEHGDGALRLSPLSKRPRKLVRLDEPLFPNDEVDTEGEPYNPEVNFRLLRNKLAHAHVVAGPAARYRVTASKPRIVCYTCLLLHLKDPFKPPVPTRRYAARWSR